MKILAIDTSSNICSVAITEDEKRIIELHSNDEKTHSVKLMPMIDEALKSTNLSLDNIDLLSCSAGPGSFTGVRIGIATIKAFSDAKQIPVTQVSSLEGLAYNTIDENIPTTQLLSTLFCSIIDARNNNVYCGLYRYYNNCLNQITDLISDNIETVISKINTMTHSFNSQFSNIVFVGDGAINYKDLLTKNFTNVGININFANKEKNIANSLSISKAGYIKYRNGNYGDSSILSPLYLRKSQAERALEENEKRL